MVRFSLEAAEELAGEGIEVEVVDPMTLFPFDYDTIIESVKKTNRLLIVHEAAQRMGIGAEISAEVTRRAFDFLDAPVERLGARNTPIPFAPVLENYVLPDSTKIRAKIRSMLE